MLHTPSSAHAFSTHTQTHFLSLLSSFVLFCLLSMGYLFLLIYLQFIPSTLHLSSTALLSILPLPPGTFNSHLSSFFFIFSRMDFFFFFKSVMTHSRVLEMKILLLRDHVGRLCRLCRRQRFRLYRHFLRTSWETFQNVSIGLSPLCWSGNHSKSTKVNLTIIWMTHIWKEEKEVLIWILLYIFFFYHLLCWLQRFLDKKHFAFLKSFNVYSNVNVNFYLHFTKATFFFQLIGLWCCIMEHTTYHVCVCEPHVHS